MRATHAPAPGSSSLHSILGEFVLWVILMVLFDMAMLSGIQKLTIGMKHSLMLRALFRPKYGLQMSCTAYYVKFASVKHCSSCEN